jgi:hypothetical protein
MRPPSLPPRGRARDRLDHVGRERRPRRSGSARHVSPARGTVPIVPGVSSATPPALRPERPMGAEKAWNGDLQTPCGSAGEARLYNASARPALPHPSPRPRHMSGRRIDHGRIADREERKFVTSPFTTHHSPASVARMGPRPRSEGNAEITVAPFIPFTEFDLPPR